MAATTTRRRPQRQQAADPTPTPVVAATPVKEPMPEGAARMQTWYIDTDGRRVRVQNPVPVDSDDQRTSHQLYRCSHKIPANGGGTRRCDHTQWLLPDSSRFCPTHGEKLVAPANPDPFGVLLREARRLHGRSAAPWALLAAEAAAGITIQITDLPVTTTGMLVPAAAVGAFVITKTHLTRKAIKDKQIERGQRVGRRIRQIHHTARRAAYLGAASSGWLTLAAATDPTSTFGRLTWVGLVGGWAIGSYPWWANADARRRRLPKPSAITVDTRAVAEAASQPQAPDPIQLMAVTRWASLIGCPNGPLAGTALTDFHRLPGCDVGGDRPRLPNWTAKVVANNPGSINMRENRPNLLGRIAAAYTCTYGDVSFAADDGDLSVAYLRVQPDNLLAEPRMWPGPDTAADWKRGRSTIGRFEDNEPIVYLWWNKLGAVHDLISGCTGSGKSEAVVQLILAGLHSGGLVLDWVGDPQGGQSFGQIKTAVDWFARDRTEITFMLLAALKEMYRRNDELSRNNIKTWRPTRNMPLLVITLDEIQSYIDDPIIGELVTKLATQGRKCGIKLRLITQIPAAYNLGDDSNVKEQLKAGQQLIFRSADEHAARAATGSDCPIDPKQLPATWSKSTCAPGEPTAGLVFVQGLAGRDVYGRTDWTGDDMATWLVDEQGQPTITPGVFGPAAQAESGVLWGDRKARIAVALASGRSDANLLSSGKAVELIEQAAMTEATGTVVRLTTASSQNGKPTARDQIMAAARKAANDQGLVDREAIVTATPDMKTNTRNTALTDLVADGQLRRIKNGLFELATKAA